MFFRSRWARILVVMPPFDRPMAWLWVPVCTENRIRVAAVMESPKLVE
jgi:hypothetical protein